MFLDHYRAPKYFLLAKKCARYSVTMKIKEISEYVIIDEIPKIDDDVNFSQNFDISFGQWNLLAGNLIDFLFYRRIAFISFLGQWIFLCYLNARA